MVLDPLLKLTYMIRETGEFSMRVTGRVNTNTETDRAAMFHSIHPNARKLFSHLKKYVCESYRTAFQKS
jgi:hypothetical protein